MNITAAPVDLKLKGMTFRLYPLPDRSYAAISLWLKAQFLESVRESLKSEEDKDTYKKIMSMAFAESRTLDWQSDEGLTKLSTFDGSVRLLYESLILVCPWIVEEFARTLLLDENGNPDLNSLTNFSDKFFIVNDLRKSENDPNKIEIDSTDELSLTFDEIRAQQYQELYERHKTTIRELSEHTPSQIAAMLSGDPAVRIHDKQELAAWMTR